MWPRKGLGLTWVLLIGLVVPVLSQNCSKDNPCATGCCSKDGWCGTGEEHCGAGNCVDTCDYKLQCDANNPCETGCCSKAGFCGLGPDYCGEDVCVASCDAKAECDPGFGPEWATSSKCPLNVCCSEFGFCGTTKEFCGNKTVKHDTCDKKTATLDRVVGYYEAWASRRPCNPFWPEQIPMGIYTHINFAFAAIDPETFEVRPDADGDLDLLMRVTQLKTMDPDLKVMIALGGWSFNDLGPTQTTFSDIARSSENQAKFFTSLKKFLSTYNLDGVDLDWEYPVADDRSGRPEDFENFPKLIANLKKALEDTGGRNELSITLPSSYWYLQHFDIVKLEPHVSFFNIMSYDLHGKWDKGNKWTGEYLDAHTNLTEIDKALELLWRNKIDSSKVVLGLAFYARAYTLADPSCVKPGCMFASGANQGNCSREVGILLNNEIDEIVAQRNLKATFYEDAAVEVLHWDDQWLSYDDAKTLELKTDYARESCLGGVMVWAVSHDTEEAKYSTALGKVTRRTRKTMPGIFVETDESDDDDDEYITKVEDHLQCRWSNCGEYCPSGWTMMTRDDQWSTTENEIMLDGNACTSPHERRLCCPPSETKPSCGWYSFKGGACEGECPDGYTEVGSIDHGCRSGYQAACCTTENKDKKLLNSMRLYETCAWSNAPDCTSGKCTFAGSPWPTEFVESTTGSGAVYCYSGMVHDDDWNFSFSSQSRKYCCDTSNHNSTWGTCTWRDDYDNFGTSGKTCSSNCHDNEIRVAMEGNLECHGKNGGAKSYCCTGTYQTTTEVLNPILSGYEADISAWADSPTCDAKTGLDLYARSEISPRDQTVLKSQHYQATLFILAKLIRGTALGNATMSTSVKSLCKIWDKYIPKHWENLTCEKVTSWFNDKEGNPTAQQRSPEQNGQWALCNMDGFNAMLDTKARTHPVCEHYDIVDADYLANDGSSVRAGTLAKRWIEQRDVLYQLEKRSPAEARSFICNDGKIKRKINYQSQPYPSAGDWDNDAEPVQNVVDLMDWHACQSSAVGRFNQGSDRNGYATEHMLELESIPMFIQWAVDPDNDEEACKDIDCSFVSDFFNKKVLNNPPSMPGLDASHQQIPMQRVMESLGSETNRENFAILWGSINLNKAQLWQNHQPRSDTTWKDYSIAVYQYLRETKMWPKFKAINNNVREEMLRAQEQYKKDNNDKDSKLQACWDAWMNHKLKEFVDDGNKWVKKAIDDLKEKYKPEMSSEDDPLGHEMYDALTAILDVLQTEAAEAIKLSNFDLGLDDGDAMDTSD
ncbi:glycoside hydrolase [Aspergillus falconensis]